MTDATGTSAAINPVCAFHGKRRSEHVCLYCCLCFENLTPDACYIDPAGITWDMCLKCGSWEEANHGR